jgi:hypothetical protein
MVDTIELNWKNEMGGACKMCGKHEWCIVGNPEGNIHLEDLGVDEKIILYCIIKKWEGA